MTDEISQTRRSSITLVVLSGVVVALHVGKVAPALAEMIQDMKLSLVVAGWLVAGISITAATLGLLMGRLVDRFGPKRLLLTGLLLSAIGSSLGAVAPTWPPLLLSRAIEGLGLLWVVISAPTLLTQRLTVKQRARVMGWWGCFMPIGTGLSIFFAPFLLPPFGWRGLWAVIAALSLLMFLLVRIYVPADYKKSSDKDLPSGGIALVLKSPALYMAGLCFGLYSFQYSATLQFIPLWLGEERGFSLFVASMIAVLYCLGNVIGNLVGGRLMLRGHTPQRLIFQFSVGMALVSVPIFRDGFPDVFRLLALLVFPIVGGVIPPAVFTLVPRLSPKPHLIASSNGLVVQLLNLGMLLGAPVQAMVVTAYGWPASTWVLLPAAIMCAALALILGGAMAREAS